MSEEIIKDIENLVKQGIEQGLDDKRFNNLALDLFKYQFDNNKLYGAYCKKKKKEPGKSIPLGVIKNLCPIK